MDFDRYLRPEEIVRYARHGILKIDLSDLLTFFSATTFDGFTISTQAINTIEDPVCYWKNGTLHERIVQSPRLYVASRMMWNEGLLEQLPKHPKQQQLRGFDDLLGFKIQTKGVGAVESFWRVIPVYNEN